jgi:small subunit ribosomal protein S20
LPAPKRKKNLSAIKKARQAEKHRERNKAEKSKLKTIAKKVASAVAEGPGEKTSPEKTSAVLKEAMQVFTKAASKGIIHKNTASRKISRLSKMAAKASKSA